MTSVPLYHSCQAWIWNENIFSFPVMGFSHMMVQTVWMDEMVCRGIFGIGSRLLRICFKLLCFFMIWKQPTAKDISEMLSVGDLWSLQVMLTCLLHLYLSQIFRCSAVHLVVRRLSVLILSAGNISGYILYPCIIYIYTHLVVSVVSAFSLQCRVFTQTQVEAILILIRLWWQQCEVFVLGFCWSCLLFLWTAVWLVFSLFSIPFGLAWCFVTRCEQSSLPGGMGLWLSTTDRAPSSLFGEILH